MAFCPKCGTQVSAGSTFCQQCGAPVAATSTVGGAAPQPAVATSTMSSNVAGLLCYILGFITGIIFLVIEPYKRDSFVRFHAFQSIFYSVACFIIRVALAAALPWSMWPLLGLVSLALFAGWVFLMFKAYNNERFKFPVIGDLAEKQAAATA
ncbi:MAG TPA: zinc-ribbon domain-containing protein [Candidatus Angelobacter sp.]|jgi:uncharacterized membrane protein|nr:zinc-ribbon domain-containing protein [Candidatus Angelobacter sp.]